MYFASSARMRMIGFLVSALLLVLGSGLMAFYRQIPVQLGLVATMPQVLCLGGFLIFLLGLHHTWRWFRGLHYDVHVLRNFRPRHGRRVFAGALIISWLFIVPGGTQMNQEGVSTLWQNIGLMFMLLGVVIAVLCFIWIFLMQGAKRQYVSLMRPWRYQEKI